MILVSREIGYTIINFDISVYGALNDEILLFLMLTRLFDLPPPLEDHKERHIPPQPVSGSGRSGTALAVKEIIGDALEDFYSQAFVLMLLSIALASAAGYAITIQADG